MRSPLFLQRILDQVVLEHLLGQQLLQSRVLGLQVLEPLGIGHAHAAELAAPQVVGRLTEAMPSAQVLDRHAGLGFAQEADDLLFGKALLHVPSPRGRELDSKLRCYSKSGGRRSRQPLSRRRGALVFSRDTRGLRVLPRERALRIREI
ncbi:unknown protein [Xanthomonas oryzae pv. oryzae KACC 10331]|uniref:Uncharacterized protein n=1 Tax=Xanthomonas oryzae pv. oryzae (strain KACC10331 / KXO85) TaxID=291331 RepID=Q5H5J8_XANOR|nr:unknown protein [Xanthomonas oryzae pv. oryzae KACC 10331]